MLLMCLMNCVLAVSDDDAEEEEESVIANNRKAGHLSQAGLYNPCRIAHARFCHRFFRHSITHRTGTVRKEVKPQWIHLGVAIGVTVQHKAFGAGKVIELRWRFDHCYF